MTRQIFTQWLNDVGYLDTINGRKYIQIHSVTEHNWTWFFRMFGMAQLCVSFSLSDEKGGKASLLTLYGHTTTEIDFIYPIWSYVSMKRAVQELTDFVNEELSH
jgi:hypothetical protein